MELRFRGYPMETLNSPARLLISERSGSKLAGSGTTITVLSLFAGGMVSRISRTRQAWEWASNPAYNLTLYPGFLSASGLSAEALAKADLTGQPKIREALSK